MISDLEGAVVLVTGAAGVLGGACCEALTEAGAKVIATDIRQSADAPAYIFLQHDVTAFDAWRRVADAVEQRFGELHGLVNSAGWSFTEKLENLDIEDWRRLQAVNIESIFHSLKLFPELLRRGGSDREGGSSVVNLSSIAGLKGARFNAAYSATKGAVRLLSKAAALEFASLGYPIRVNSVHPGSIDSDMVAGINQRYVELGLATSVEEARAAMVASSPVKRLGRPRDIGNAVRFLCSTDSAFMTGSEVVVDGGFTA